MGATSIAVARIYLRQRGFHGVVAPGLVAVRSSRNRPAGFVMPVRGVLLQAFAPTVLHRRHPLGCAIPFLLVELTCSWLGAMVTAGALMIIYSALRNADLLPLARSYLCGITLATNTCVPAVLQRLYPPSRGGKRVGLIARPATTRCSGSVNTAARNVGGISRSTSLASPRRISGRAELGILCVPFIFPTALPVPMGEEGGAGRMYGSFPASTPGPIGSQSRSCPAKIEF